MGTGAGGVQVGRFELVVDQPGRVQCGPHTRQVPDPLAARTEVDRDQAGHNDARRMQAEATLFGVRLVDRDDVEPLAYQDIYAVGEVVAQVGRAGRGQS